MRTAALVLLAILVAASLLPAVEAQTRINPLCSPPPTISREAYCSYEEQYLVMGRVLDANDRPAKGARVIVTIDQEGVVDAQGNKPTLSGVANCKGDFEFSLAGLRKVSSSGNVQVTVESRDEGHADVTKTESLESFWRRNDVTVNLPYTWNYACADAADPAWGVLVSVKGRLLNRTAPYEVGGATYEAKPHLGYIALYWWDTNGRWFCPPDGRGGCQPIPTDELGNFKYTWTFGDNVPAGGTVEVVTADNRSFNATVDPITRLAVHQIEVSGQGPPKKDETPGAGLLLVAAAAALVALARGRRARR